MQQSLSCDIRLPECSSLESHPMQTFQSLFLRIAHRHQKRWFQADEVTAIYNADFSGTLASGGPCLIIVILRGIQDDLGRTLLLTKFLPYTLRVPRIIADLFWLSIQGTVTVLFASEKVCPFKGTFRAVGWLRFRELCPSCDLRG